MEFYLLSQDGTPEKHAGRPYRAFGRLAAVLFEIDGTPYSGFFGTDTIDGYPVLRSWAPVIVAQTA